MKRLELIESLIADTKHVKAEAQAFAELNKEDLATRPGPEQWSVLECIEHLNIADEHYISEFEAKLEKATPSEKEVFKPGWIGNYFVKSMKPREDGTIPSPMKTLRKFVPEVNVQFDTLSKFIEDQDTLLQLLEQSKTLDLNKIKITSAIGAIVTFKLGDAFRFLIAHNQRHILQAQRALEKVQVAV